MPVLFCNVGWMDFYDGIDGDTLQRGGSYNNDFTGHEVCNFTDAKGTVFGYVRPTGRLKIEKLGANKEAESVEGVTVVWTAGPDAGGTAVVGWYKNATVYRDPQPLKKKSGTHKKNGIEIYQISALASDVHLIPVADRDLMIPRSVKGGIGQSNVWYADAPEAAELVKRVLARTEQSTNDTRLPDVDEDPSGKEGNPRFVAHLRRERNRGLVAKKKAQVLNDKKSLSCEVCEFDFHKVYGPHGLEFCEVHHLTPLHQSDGEKETRLSDLAVVCSNCHRIIHRMKKMPSIAELKEIIANPSAELPKVRDKSCVG